MKNLFISLLAILLFTGISCDNSHIDNVENEKSGASNDGDTLLDYEEVLIRRRSNDKLDSTTYAASLNKDRTTLYQNLEMSPDDIQRFEEAHTEQLQTMRSKGWNNYTLQDLDDMEDVSMRNTLTNPQYRKYLEMKAKYAE